MEFISAHGWVWLIGLGGFLALWPVSLIRRDASIVDFWWGPGFGAMALAVWNGVGRPTDGYTLAILVPLMLWSLRLGIHLGLRRLSEGEEDARYKELRAAWSPGWTWKSLFIVFILQAVLQGISAAGVLAGLAVAEGVTATPLIWLLCAIALAAVAVETASDLQLDLFRRKVPKGGLLTTGLRGIVRYPSYAAEIVFWSALSLMAVCAGVWWAPLSAAIIGLLLRYVSGVAVLDDRLSRSRPEFAAYRNAVPMLIPRLAPGRPDGWAGNRTSAD